MGDRGHKFSAELNRLEKEIGWYKLVAKTFEPENEQKYIPLECNLPPVAKCSKLHFSLFFYFFFSHKKIKSNISRHLSQAPSQKLLFFLLKCNCIISECNRQSEVIRLLEEYQNSSSTGSEETYYDDYETEDPNCTCDSGHTHEHQVRTMGLELL